MFGLFYHTLGCYSTLFFIFFVLYLLKICSGDKLFNFFGISQEKFAALAPMAGTADSPFRTLCMSYGAAFCVGEMVSAKGICFNDRKSKELMMIEQSERPCAVQLFGSTPEDMKNAAVSALDFSPDFIDINMGCPAPKVTSNGCGSALMKDIAIAERIIGAVVDAVKIPVSVKFRKGWDENSVNSVELAKAAEANGASFITVHGRTRQQMYAPSVDLDAIKAVKKAVSIPVIGNGDIFTADDAKRMYEYTECDFVMAGRGTLGAPWLFSQINALLSRGDELPPPTVAEKMNTMISHAESVCAAKGEHCGMLEMRKHALWYTKGLRGSAKLRNKFSTVSELHELSLLAEEVVSLNGE